MNIVATKAQMSEDANKAGQDELVDGIALVEDSSNDIGADDKTMNDGGASDGNANDDGSGGVDGSGADGSDGVNGKKIDVIEVASEVEALDAMTESIRGFIGEGGDAEALIAYVTEVVGSRMQIGDAASAAEAERAIARRAVVPICAAAKIDSALGDATLFSILANYDESAIAEDIEDSVLAGDLTIPADEIDVGSVMDAVIELCVEGLGEDAGIDSVLSDVARFHRQRRGDELPKIDVIRGFWKNLKAQRRCLHKQVETMESASRFVSGRRDVQIWFSRYLLGAAIELAKEGYVVPLKHIACYGGDLIRDECSYFAKHVGVDLPKGDVDLDQVRSAMRSFCVSKTGYQNASCWLSVALREEN